MRLILLSASLVLLTANAPVCRETIHHADGTVSERTVPDDGATSSSASSRSGGSGSASSSVSASSSSTSGSAETSSASFSGDHGRSVTVDRKDGQCRIKITER